MKHSIAIQGEYIELFRLLKLARLVETGGQAKELIRMESVTLEGSVVSELRKKIRPGNTVVMGDEIIEVTAAAVTE